MHNLFIPVSINTPVNVSSTFDPPSTLSSKDTTEGRITSPWTGVKITDGDRGKIFTTEVKSDSTPKSIIHVVDNVS